MTSDAGADRQSESQAIASAPKTWASGSFGLARVDAHEPYAAFERVFGRAWLETGPVTNRVVETWRRDDFLAGLEVAAVGAAVLDVERIDASWLAQIARRIRGAGGGEEHGFIFELVACGMFAAGGMNVRPAAKAASGYDAQISFDDGYRLRLSFKNFELSSHELTFRKRCEGLRQQFRAILPPGRAMRLSVQGRVHLEHQDFVALAEHLPHLMQGATVEVVPGRVAANVRELRPESGDLPFARNSVSDQCIFISPEHSNEQLRVEGKLRNACINMAKHCRRSPATGNLLLVRLHPGADVGRLADRALQLVSRDTPEVDAILLYQPSLVRTREGKTVLVHCVRFVHSPSYDARGHGLRVVPLFGMFSDKANETRIEGPGNRSLTLGNHLYVYQAGDLYRTMNGSFPMGELKGTVGSPGQGLNTHLVVEMEDGSSSEIHGLFPAHDNLRLL